MCRFVCQRVGGGWKGKNGEYQQKGEAVTGQKPPHDIEAELQRAYCERGHFTRNLDRTSMLGVWLT